MKRTPLRRQGRKGKAAAKAVADQIPALFKRSGGKCERCGSRWSAKDPHHLIPRQDRKGEHDLENLVYLCRSCHSRIHDHTVDDWDKWILRSEMDLEERHPLGPQKGGTPDV